MRENFPWMDELEVQHRAYEHASTFVSTQVSRVATSSAAPSTDPAAPPNPVPPPPLQRVEVQVRED